jgi:Methane/Phenol/Alkene Hydroxylase
MTGQQVFEGHRRFTWFMPEKSFPTEYESLTIGQQSTPNEWLHVNWPVRFDDGRAPFMEESTAVRCVNWNGFRDPAKLTQRSHVATTNQHEQMLVSLLQESCSQSLLGRLDPVWRDCVLGKYYAAWPFVENGQFLALSYAVREALAAALTFGLAFQISDRLRHGQDIVHYLAALEETLPDFSDAKARDAWMSDPALVPLRETLEQIILSRDWGEILVAINLVLEPLAGELFKLEFLAKHAAVHGDFISPVILARTGADTRRHQQFAIQFARFVLADPKHGRANRESIQNWLDRWIPLGEQAAKALRPIFELEGLNVEPFDDCFTRVQIRHQQIIAECLPPLEKLV